MQDPNEPERLIDLSADEYILLMKYKKLKEPQRQSLLDQIDRITGSEPNCSESPNS